MQTEKCAGDKISVHLGVALVTRNEFLIFENKSNNDGNHVDRCYAPAFLRCASISSNSAAQYVIKQN